MTGRKLSSQNKLSDQAILCVSKHISFCFAQNVLKDRQSGTVANCYRDCTLKRRCYLQLSLVISVCAAHVMDTLVIVWNEMNKRSDSDGDELNISNV